MQRFVSEMLFLVLLAAIALSPSCAKKEEQQPETRREAAESGAHSLVDENIAFGLYFDEEGTQLTLRLAEGQSEFTGYLILNCPEHMRFRAVEWRLEMPAGVEIANMMYREDRTLALGKISSGLSEVFNPCLECPRIVLHTLTFKASTKLSNATFAVLPSLEGELLGGIECMDERTMIQGIAYESLVNPSE